jgi:hypothetical protein
MKPLWLENSVRFGEPEDEEFYSPDPHKFFSGLCVCSSQVLIPFAANVSLVSR